LPIITLVDGTALITIRPDSPYASFVTAGQMPVAAALPFATLAAANSTTPYSVLPSNYVVFPGVTNIS
jgi:hypothetical protein